MATITDIARAVGVSDVTVSRVLQRGTSYRRPTYARRADEIRRLATELGYRPNASAIAMRSGRFQCIALLLSSDHVRSQLPAGLLGGIQSALHQRDLHLMVDSLPDHTLTSDADAPKLLRQLMSDGLLINYNARIPERMIELIQDHGLPSVWINSKQDHDCIHPDDEAAGAEATRRLLELGHRRIVYVDYVSSTPPWHYSPIDRYRGYARAMHEAGLPAGRYGHPSIWGRGEIVSSAKALLSNPERPTAVICYGGTDVRAVQCAAEGVELGVPRDLSIITFNELALADLGPRISTMLLPETEMGRRSVEMLVEKIKNPSRPQAAVAVPFAWEPGESVAQVRSFHSREESFR